MDRPVGPASFGQPMRRWRTQGGGPSPLALALDAEVSPRHLSWLESGKSVLSRAMVQRQAGWSSRRGASATAGC